MDFTEEQQAEIKKQVDEAVSKAIKETTEKLEKEHNEKFSAYRVKRDDEQKKAVETAREEAKLSQDELAKKQVEEQIKAKDTELNELRAYKKTGELTKKLSEAGLPTLFVNDSRLQNATDEEVDNVIKTIKDEFAKVMPEGATLSTNVDTSNGDTTKKVDKFKDFRNLR